MQAGLAISGSERCPLIPTWRISATQDKGHLRLEGFLMAL